MHIIKQIKSKLGNDINLVENLTFTENKSSSSINSHEKTIIIIGVFHGDEPQGKFMIEKYIEKDTLNECKNRLLFIPCLNPDGMLMKKRTNSNGVDLNRNFPAKNWELSQKDIYYGGDNSGSELETQFLVDTIDEFKPDAILTLHAPYKVVNYDGPAENVAKKISEIINYPVEESIGYPTPGSFGTYSGIERNIPTITLELDEICPVEDLISPVHEIFDYLSEY